MPYNKGTLDSYRKIVCRELGVATGSGTHSGSAWISGSLVVYGEIKGTTFSGPIASSPHAASHYSGSTDEVNIAASQVVSGSFPISVIPTGSIVIDTSQIGSGEFTVAQGVLSDALLTQIRTHSPSAHAGTHISGSSDAVTIFKNQISDINDSLNITGSGISSISGSLILTGSFSGSDYYGPAVHVQTGSATTYGRRTVNFTDAGGMIISMTDDPSNDRVTVAMQASGSGGGSLANSVVASHVYAQADSYGVAADGSRSDHVHGTPGLYESAATDVATAGAAGSNASGSHGDHTHRGILSLATSGSTDLYGRTYITGSTPNIISTQSGQTVQLALGTSLSGITNITATNISGSTLLSGANILGASATITNITGSTLVSGSNFLGPTATITSVNATNITGSSILSGANIYGTTAVITNVTSENITGSTSISGSSVFGKDAVITNVTANYITGSTLVSGSLRGPDAIITNITATNITGSTLVSGSTFAGVTANIININSANVTGSSILSGANIYGAVATITNVYVTNLTGSGTISGSTVAATTLTVGTFNPTNVNTTNVTGSSNVSGSTVYAGTVFSGSKLVVTGNISGSSITASYLPMKGLTNSSTPYTGSAINIKAGTNVTLIGDNDSGYVGYTISSNTGSGELSADYTIWSGSGLYYSQNGHTGVITSNANAATLINAAIDALPARDDTMATVALKGEITISASITLASFTRLIILGELKASAAISMITLDDTEQMHTEICGGGLINGNNTGTIGIVLNGSGGNESYRSHIHDLTIVRCTTGGLYLEGDHRALVSDIYVYYCGTYGFRIASYDNKFNNCVVLNSGTGFLVESTNNYVSNCKGCGETGYGFYVTGDRTGLSNCNAQENELHGFYIAANNVSLAGCSSDRNSLLHSGVSHNYYIMGTNITMVGCESYNFAAAAAQDALHIGSTATNVRVSGFTTDGEHLGYDVYVDPSASEISVEGIKGEYQTQAGAWASPSTTLVSGFNNRRVLVYNSTAGQYRLYTYMNGGWHYVSFDA